MAKTSKPYQDLAAELRAQLAQVETLQGERSAFLEEQERLSKAREQIGNSIFESRGKGNGPGNLVSKLEALEREQKVLAVQLEALGGHLAAREAELHQLLPKACFAFQRLCSALRQTVKDQTQAAITAFIDPSRRETYREHCEMLSEHSVAMQALADIALPSGGSWSLTRSLDTTEADRLARPATMALVMSETKRLLTNVDRTFAEIERYSAEPPTFLLGEPEPEPEQPLQGLEPVEVASLDSFQQEEREFVLAVCRESGKTLDTLTDGERLVLANTLANWRDKFRGRHPRIAVGRQADY